MGQSAFEATMDGRLDHLAWQVQLLSISQHMKSRLTSWMMQLATSGFLLLVVMHLATSSFLLLVAMHFSTSSFLLLVVMPLLLVVMHLLLVGSCYWLAQGGALFSDQLTHEISSHKRCEDCQDMIGISRAPEVESRTWCRHWSILVFLAP